MPNIPNARPSSPDPWSAVYSAGLEPEFAAWVKSLSKPERLDVLRRLGLCLRCGADQPAGTRCGCTGEA